MKKQGPIEERIVHEATLSFMLDVLDEATGGRGTPESIIQVMEDVAVLVLKRNGFSGHIADSRLLEALMPDSGFSKQVDLATEVVWNARRLRQFIAEGQTRNAVTIALNLGARTADSYRYDLIEEKYRGRIGASAGGKKSGESRIDSNKKARQRCLQIAKESSLMQRDLCSHVARQLEKEGVTNPKTSRPFNLATIRRWLKEGGVLTKESHTK